MGNNFLDFVKNNLTKILTVVGVGGVILTAGAAISEGPKATKAIEEAEEKKGEELTTLEKVKVAWPKLKKTIIFGAATIGANVMACTHGTKLLAAAVATGVTAVQSNTSLKQAIEEKLGIEGANDIYKIAKDKVLAEQKKNTKVVRCYENFLDDGGRFFEAPLEDLYISIYKANRTFQETGAIVVNDLYRSLNLPGDEKIGNKFGWFMDDEWFDNYGSSWIDFYVRRVTDKDGVYYILGNDWNQPTFVRE